MNYPTPDAIVNLHKKYAKNLRFFDLVYTHCRIVNEITEQIMQNKKLSINLQLVKAGSLLHDIGAYNFMDESGFNKKEYIRHGIIGYEILKNEGFPEALCRIASHHTGVGLSKAEILEKGLPLPVEDYLAESLEERLIMYADKFHSKHPQFNAYMSFRQKIAAFGKDKMIKFDKLKDEFGLPDLEKLANKYQMPIN